MSTNVPKFSIIIPTFNRGNHLIKCLKSLEKQSFKNFEVLVCDDGSTDNTKEVIEEFKVLLNLIYIYDTNFGGPAKPRNNGLKKVNGEFIAFLDSDDWWYPNKLEITLQYLADHDIVYHDLDIYTKEGKSNRIAKGRILSGNIAKDLILNGNGIINSSVVIRKEIVDLIGEFSEDKKIIAVEDYDYWIRAAKVTNRFKYINQSLGGYWVGENISYSTKQIDRAKSLLDKYFSELSPFDQKSALSLYYFNSARIYQTLAFFPEARQFYLKALFNSRSKRVFKSILGYLICHFRIR